MGELLSWLVHLWNVSTFDHRAKVAEIAVTGVSIVVGAWVAGRQLKKGHDHEVRIKVHEQRRANYDFFFENFLDKVMSHQKEVAAGQAPADWAPVSEKEMIELNSKMMRYASGDVIRLWLEFQAIGRSGTNSEKGLVKFGELLTQMRKEIGLEEGTVASPRDLLSTFVTDLQDPQYDYLFKKRRLWHPVARSEPGPIVEGPRS